MCHASRHTTFVLIGALCVAVAAGCSAKSAGGGRSVPEDAGASGDRTGRDGGSTGSPGSGRDDTAGSGVCPDYPYAAGDCDDPEAEELMKARDSDTDGLTDYEEVCEHDTDPCNEDSDGDGVTDAAEVFGSMTDPNDSTDTVSEEDFYVVLPYEGERQERTLRFSTDIKVADVFFLVDTTGSMRDERQTLIEGLLDVIIPGIEERIDNVQFGAGGFDDYPYGGYGGSNDQPFYLLHEIVAPDQDIGQWSLAAGPTTAECPENAATNDIGEIVPPPNDVPDILESVEGLPCHGGSDLPESYVPALWATATGEGLSWPGGSIPAQDCPEIPDSEGELRGYPCFRPGALPIILLFGDNYFHNGPSGYDYSFAEAPGYDETVDALNDLGARVVGIYSTYNPASPGSHLGDYEAIATDTGAVRADGSPLVFPIDSSGTGLDSTIVDAVAELVGGTPQDVNTRTENVDGNPDDFDATQFIKGIVPEEGYDSAGMPGEGYASKDGSTFYEVIPGSTVEFSIDFYNDVRPPEKAAQVFEARIIVIGNGVTDLDSRKVYIVVPPDRTLI